MADDTSYSTFLAKANADPNSGGDNPIQSTSQARSAFDPTTSSDALPASLRNLPSTTYTSDTDSEFETVFFNYAGDLPLTAEQFKQVLSKKGDVGDVEELSVEDFDPRGEYTEIQDRVRQASDAGKRAMEGDSNMKIFRVQKSKTRVEYYILTVGDRKLFGVVARAVES
jgi:hypothetical protein